VLDDLIERYGESAILRVSPYMLDTGEILRWIVEIDGNDVMTSTSASRRNPM
jgi:hypothetical protein